MAEIYVTSTADSGAGSLRQAIADANDGDVILFDSDVFPVGQTTSILLSSRLYLTKSLALYGGFSDGADGYTSGAIKEYYVYRDVESVKTKVIINDETPALDDETVLFENICRVALDGQETVYHFGIPSSVGAATFSGIEFVNGHNSNGGSISLSGSTSTIKDCAFKSCVSSDQAGAVYAYGATTDKYNTISSCSFYDCKGNNGGAITSSTTAESRLDNCCFDSCAVNGSGAVIYSAVSSRNTLNDCVIINCSATNGGALFSNNNSINILNNCLISGCSATTNGGGVYSGGYSQNTLNGCNILDCHADNYGGGIYTTNHSHATLNNCSVSDCSAFQGAAAYITALSDGQFTLNDCNILNCTATQYGGCLVSSNTARTAMNNCLIEGCVANIHGGGLFFSSASQNTVSNCTIKNCTAARYGGGVYANSTSQSSITGGTITNCSASDNGGGIFTTNSSTITVVNCVFAICSSNIGGGFFFGSAAQSSFTDCSIINCSAQSGAGGGYLTSNDSLVTLTRCSFLDCSAQRAGGVQLDSESTSIFVDCVFNNCVASTGLGGGLRAIGKARCELNGCTFDTASSFDLSSATPLDIKGGITTIAKARLSSAPVTIADGAALTITDSAQIVSGSTISSEGRGYFAVGAGINTSAATLENVALCAYGADVSSFAEVDGVLEWEAANPTTTVLIERADGDSWTTVTQTAGESLTLYLPPSDTVRLFDGVQFFTAQAPSQRTYYYIGGSEGSFTSAADWSLRRGGVAITEPPVVAGQRFIVGDISSGE